MYFSYNDNIDIYQELHDCHNERILNLLNEFKTVNHLKAEDFYVTGSSCASYMNYIITEKERDVDIILNNENISKSNLIAIPGIDIISKDFINKENRHEYIFKDGYYFCSAEDVLVHVSMKAYVTLQENPKDFVSLLLDYLNLTVKEYLPVFCDIANNSRLLSDEHKNRLLPRLYLMYKWHNPLVPIQFKAMPKSYFEKENIAQANMDNNEHIVKYLNIFCETNNLDKKDFVVMGSAAASYMQYLAITQCHDIDVHVFNSQNKNLQYTGYIDLIRIRPFIPKDFQNRVVEKDGFLFISEQDFIISLACAILWRRNIKSSHLRYIRLMINELKLSEKDFKDLIINSIDELLVTNNIKAALKNRINTTNLLDYIYEPCK